MKKLFPSFKEFIYHNRLLALQLYWLIYLPWFAFVENKVTSHFHVIHMELDDHIPFVPVFIIPYLLWFGYVAVAILNSYLHDKPEYLRACGFLFTGMTVFLIVSTVYPNGHYMRYTVSLGDSMFDQMIRRLWMTDTATNLFPSIHVFNSIGAHIALSRSENSRNNKAVKCCSFVLMCSIILSTMLIKQHSVFDVMMALAMALVLYPVFYSKAPENTLEKARDYQKAQKRRKKYKDVQW